MTRRGFAGLAVGGTVALAAWGAAGFGTFTAPHIENSAASIAEHTPTPPEPAVVTAATPATKVASADANLPASLFAPAASSAPAAPALAPVSPAPCPQPPP